MIKFETVYLLNLGIDNDIFTQSIRVNSTFVSRM